MQEDAKIEILVLLLQKKCVKNAVSTRFCMERRNFGIDFVMVSLMVCKVSIYFCSANNMIQFKDKIAINCNLSLLLSQDHTLAFRALRRH